MTYAFVVMAKTSADTTNRIDYTGYDESFIVEGPPRYAPSPVPLQLKHTVSVAGNVALGQAIALSMGIDRQEWECLYQLGMRESGWKVVKNPLSSAYGIFQFLDSTWKGTGYKKSSDPSIQIEAGITYIFNRYGTSCRAVEFQIKNNYY